MLLIFTIRVAFHSRDEESAGWAWWPPRSEHREVYDFNLELDVSTLPCALPFVLTNPTTSTAAHSHSELHVTLHLFIFSPLSTPPATPTLFLSPTPLVYLFFHQIELVESKGIPTIPSQSWVRERGTLKMKGSGAQFRCRSLRVCVAMGVDLCLGLTKKASLLPKTPRRILRLQDGTVFR